MKKLVYKNPGTGQVVPKEFDLDFITKLPQDTWKKLEKIFIKLEAYEASEVSPEQLSRLITALETLKR